MHKENAMIRGWRGIAALMKASPTVIYDIGMSGMVTRPMGRAELRRYLDASMDVRDQRAWGEQLICRSQFYQVTANGDELVLRARGDANFMKKQKRFENCGRVCGQFIL